MARHLKKRTARWQLPARTHAALGVMLAAIMVFGLLLSACASPNPPPRASKGVLDLSKWNFASEGPTSLSGQWSFDWQQLLPPSAPAGSTPRHGFIDLPAMWNSRLVATRLLGAYGYASFRLTVLLPAEHVPLALRFRSMGTAYTIFVNGQRVGSAGTVGKTATSSYPDWRPQVLNLNPADNKLEMLLHVSNFHHRKGGPVEAIDLGPALQVQRSRELDIAWQMLFAGAIFAISLYHLGLTLIQRRDLAALYFALFCMAIGIYTLLSGERYFATIFPASSWETRVRLTNFSSFVAVPLFLTFIAIVYRKQVPRLPVRIVQAVVSGLCLLVLLTPARWYTQTIPFFHLMVLAGAAVIIVTLFRARRQRQEGAVILMAGFAVFLVAIINDVLYDNLIIQTGQFIYVGLFFFIFAQSVLLSARYARAFRRLDEQGVELAEVNAGIRQEITDRREAQGALVDSELRFRSIVDNTDDIIYTADKDGVIETINEYGAVLLGVQREQSGRRLLDFVHPGDVKRCEEAYRAATESRQQIARALPLQIDLDNGRSIWVAINSRIIYDDHGKMAQEYAVARDITAQKHSERKLAQSLDEKETLLKEVHHRVKNNLQIVSSLLAMQMGHTEDSSVHSLLSESASRIRSMALIHEQLYASTSLERIDFGDYAERLTRFLARSLAPGVEFEVKSEVVELTIDVAVPCGLILNELVTNALKYGASAEGRNYLKVQVSSEDDGFSLTVTDKGPGLPAEIDPSKANTLGLQIVHNLSRQLRATLEVNCNAGTEFRLHYRTASRSPVPESPAG